MCDGSCLINYIKKTIVSNIALFLFSSNFTSYFNIRFVKYLQWERNVRPTSRYKFFGDEPA